MSTCFVKSRDRAGNRSGDRAEAWGGGGGGARMGAPRGPPVLPCWVCFSLLSFYFLFLSLSLSLFLSLFLSLSVCVCARVCFSQYRGGIGWELYEYNYLTSYNGPYEGEVHRVRVVAQQSAQAETQQHSSPLTAP